MKIHRDRPRDDVRAAKDSPPLRGWPRKVADGGELLGRAAWPALRPSPCQPPSSANPDHLRYRVRALLMLVLAPLALSASETKLVPDVSQRDIEIRYSFTGAELLLFGAILYPQGRAPSQRADIAVVVK